MAPPSLALLISCILLACTAAADSAGYAPMTLTVVNNCPYTIWPAIQPNTGSAILEDGGFTLPTLAYRSFPAPDAPWSGRIWARTGCSTSSNGATFRCATGDCVGRLQCQGAGGTPPVSLAQLSLHNGGAADKASYGVSFVDGFNVPVTITPHLGRGQCPVVGCKAPLLDTCPPVLQHRSAAGGAGALLGCKSGCLAFNSDALCCRGPYNSPKMCRPSPYSDFFKKACPDTYTYAYDTPAVPQDCAAPGELKVIFCH